MTHRPQPILLPTAANVARAALYTYRTAEPWSHRPRCTLEAGELLADIYDLPGAGLLIAVRGTDGLANWAYSLDAGRRQSDYLPGSIHRGFATASLEITEPLRQWMVSHGGIIGRRVELCGHSLGGAIVTYLAPWIVQQGGWVTGVSTYGSPRVGNGRYASEWCRLLHDVSTRRVNSTDAVPMLPPALMGYCHVPGLLYYDRYGAPCKHGLIGRWMDRLAAMLAHLGTPGVAAAQRHAMARYVDCIEGQQS